MLFFFAGEPRLHNTDIGRWRFCELEHSRHFRIPGEYIWQRRQSIPKGPREKGPSRAKIIFRI